MSVHPPSYVLECVTESVISEVRFNDWVAVRSQGHGSHSVSARINAFALDGGNVLRVMLKPWELPPPSAPYFTLNLFRMLAEDEVVPLVQFRYHPTLHPLEKDGFVEVFRHECSLADQFGPWLWEEAAPYRNEDRLQLIAGLQELHATLEQADGASFVELFDTKLRELARAHGQSPDGSVTRQRLWLSELFKMDVFRVEPLEPDDLRLESMCQGRVVEVKSPKGEAPLRAWLGGDRLHFDVMMTRQGERWIAIR